jgi:predicted AAA+ superfamily ATPase
MRNIIRRKIVDGLAAPVPEFTRRDIRLPGVAGKAVAVVGMRRTGKTTFLWQVLAERQARGTGREGLLYFNFEDERLAGMTASHLEIVLEEYYRLNPEWRGGRRAVFFFDEMQNVPGWEVFARRVMDTERVELFVSGSSARLLSREVASSMRGRAMEALVHPFSFRESLRHAGREPGRPPSRLPKASRSALDKSLQSYLTRGGFPEAQGIQQRDRFDLLCGYVDTCLLRDVVERHAATHPVALRWMIRQLLGDAGGTFSINKFHRDLKSRGIAVSKDTLHAYLAHLEDAFLVRIVSLESGSERRRMVNPRKVYPVDPALIPVFDRSGRANLGHALETCVHLELERRGASITYVRTADGLEVDFLARYPEGPPELIQVCVDLDDPAAREREVRALVSAGREHPRASLHVIGLTLETVRGLPENVALHAASSWLLSCDDRAERR